MADPFREHKAHFTFGDLVGDLRELMRRFWDQRLAGDSLVLASTRQAGGNLG
ncbi:MAG: hypothetical protein L0Y39_00165 [Methylococcaceae bacterium]|nr:hypothetical protein [Methylococcaceae bacterium]